MMMKMQDETQSSSYMIIERYAMAVLYFATDGPNWLEQWNYLSNSSICDWQNCNDEGSVVELSLSKCVRLYTVYLFERLRTLGKRVKLLS
jgi:hypothetical protein